jgi:hypothetical protein
MTVPTWHAAAAERARRSSRGGRRRLSPLSRCTRPTQGMILDDVALLRALMRGGRGRRAHRAPQRDRAGARRAARRRAGRGPCPNRSGTPTRGRRSWKRRGASRRRTGRPGRLPAPHLSCWLRRRASGRSRRRGARGHRRLGRNLPAVSAAHRRGAPGRAEDGARYICAPPLRDAGRQGTALAGAGRRICCMW